MQNKIDSEILAAISAALASYSQDKGIKLVVKSIRRTPQASPVWNTVGRYERLGRRLS